VAVLELLTIKIQQMTIESTNDNNSTNPAITYSKSYAQVFSRLFFGDCLIESDKIENGSVDLILTDLPYGTVKGLGGDIEKYKRLSNSDWDNVIDTNKIMKIANRILRKNGKMILFSQDPFSTELKNKAIPNLPFNYSMIWEKDHFANCLLAKKAPLNYFEDILIFSKKACYEAKHPLKAIFFEIYENHGKEKCLNAIRTSGRFSSEQSVNFHTSIKFGYGQGMVFELMVEELFNHCKQTIDIPFEYGYLKEIDEQYKKEYASTFNIWEGKKYKSNILKYKKDYDGHHPTQKPVLLLEDLIKTFSNEGNLVVDLTMGSGSTGVACKNTNRSFIGIEKDEAYFKIAEQRINARTLFS
jgi:site-specific DNA-methyltransferase (adenine-specific)